MNFLKDCLDQKTKKSGQQRRRQEHDREITGRIRQIEWDRGYIDPPSVSIRPSRDFRQEKSKDKDHRKQHGRDSSRGGPSSHALVDAVAPSMRDYIQPPSVSIRGEHRRPERGRRPRRPADDNPDIRSDQATDGDREPPRENRRRSKSREKDRHANRHSSKRKNDDRHRR